MGSKGGCCISRHEYPCVSPSEVHLGAPSALSMISNNLKDFFFPWTEGLNSGLNIIGKPCCKCMCHSSFVDSL